MKNKHAQKLGELRWEKVPKKERIRHMTEMSKKAAAARQEKLSTARLDDLAHGDTIDG